MQNLVVSSDHSVQMPSPSWARPQYGYRRAAVCRFSAGPSSWGLVSQRFWFRAVMDSGQLGVAVVAFACALAWLKGLWVHWLAPRPPSAVGTLALPPESRPKRSISAWTMRSAEGFVAEALVLQARPAERLI